MGIKTYDPTAVTVSFGALILSGFADGTFVTVSRSNDAFTKVSGADGTVSRAKSADRSGEVTVVLQSTSPSNLLLSAIALEDEVITSGVGVLPLVVKDAEGSSVYFAGSAWIRKTPDGEFSKEITDRTWIFDTGQLDMLAGGN
jgi:hypothetical protein